MSTKTSEPDRLAANQFPHFGSDAVAAQEGFTNEDGLRTAVRQSFHIAVGVNTAFGDEQRGTGVSLQPGCQVYRRGQIHLKGIKVAIIHPDEFRTNSHRALQFRLVMHFHQSCQPGFHGKGMEARELFLGKYAHDQQNGVRKLNKLT